MKKVTLNKRHNNLVKYFDLIESDDPLTTDDYYQLKSNRNIYIQDTGKTYEVNHMCESGATYTTLYGNYKILYEAMFVAMKLDNYKFTNDHILLEEK
tara:strand:+ start:1535 stop:1825 length:291 start_codon:yes stop_codon:yes gene_type:complete